MQAGSQGPPLYYAVIGDNFHFGPSGSDDYAIDLVYYAALDILSPTVATNWISENVPELLLFAALMEAAKWLKDDARLAVWQGSYEEIKKELLESESRMDLEGGALAVREVSFKHQGSNRLTY